ncbi:hypothetical protein ACLOJK_034803 [Asimina triloba]
MEPTPAIVRSSMQLASSSRSIADTIAPRGRPHLQQSSGGPRQQIPSYEQPCPNPDGLKLTLYRTADIAPVFIITKVVGHDADHQKAAAVVPPSISGPNFPFVITPKFGQKQWLTQMAHLQATLRCSNKHPSTG